MNVAIPNYLLNKFQDTVLIKRRAEISQIRLEIVGVGNFFIENPSPHQLQRLES